MEITLDPAELTQRLFAVEADCFALTKLCEALIATHPDRVSLMAAWRDQKERTKKALLETMMREPPTPESQHEFGVFRDRIDRMEAALHVPPHIAPRR